MAAAEHQQQDAAAGSTTMLYHLVQQELWDKAKATGQPYKPPTYDKVRPHTPHTPDPGGCHAASGRCRAVG